MLLNKPQIETHTDIERKEGQKIRGEGDLNKNERRLARPREKQIKAVHLKKERDGKNVYSPCVPSWMKWIKSSKSIYRKNICKHIHYNTSMVNGSFVYVCFFSF